MNDSSDQPPRTDPYLLGDSSAEIRHLVSQAEVYASEADDLFERIGLRAGASVADVGCGVLGVLHLLRDRVGPSGRVVGIDREPRLLDAARQIATARGVEVELFEGDATDLQLPADSFDLTHERTVLLNVAEPGRVVAEMVRITRPGGVVVVQEPDASAWVCDPPHPAWETLRDAAVGAYAAAGKNFNRGRTAARLLRDSGFVDVHVRVTARATARDEYYQTFLLALCGLVRDQIIATQDLGADRFDALTKELTEHLARPDTITCQPTMWQAWGRKP
jgi:ubiquinone/menaquinone biosynthesis C-methylase UbiE